MPRNFKEIVDSIHIEKIIFKMAVGPFSASSKNANTFPELKGIYFWFLTEDGLRLFSKNLSSETDLLPNSFLTSKGYLVYIGQAGCRKTNNNKGNLRQRIKWHINETHKFSSVKSGVLSTLRQTLGALLSDDLLEHNGVETETIINDFMEQYFTIYYISYDGMDSEVVKDVLADEKLLINQIMPLLNIKGNDNAKKTSLHPTQQIKMRRNFVRKNTLKRFL